MATLGSLSRHSIGDLTMHILKFTTITTDDSYGITNMPGVIAVWNTSWLGADTLNNMGIQFTNSASGPTLSFTPALALTADVFVISHG